MKNWIIRRAEKEDTLGIWQSHIDSIRQICSKDYTQEQIEAWSGFAYSPQKITEKIHNDFVWVLEKSSQIHGHTHFKIRESQGHLIALYLDPTGSQKGFGKKMMIQVLEKSRELRLESIHLQSTKTALNFYQDLGFKKLDSEKSSLTMRGVKIDCIPMSLVL
ncbi:MAG: GNAT family N-acetyltransferase [Halobacteriovoraceae bacterium]|nr:GNAT family N-acetyltransferase [Halobacteriovoraceae bacterium]